MFTSLLSNLQSLISSRFVVASFFPTLAFWFGHGVMLFRLNGRFHDYVVSNIGQTAGIAAVVMAAALVGVAFSAYAASALLPTVQSLMEGNWPGWAVWLFAPTQVRRYDRLGAEIDRNIQLRGPLEAVPAVPVGQTQMQVDAWKLQLLQARKDGQDPARRPHGQLNIYTSNTPSAKTVAKLDRKRSHAGVIAASELKQALEQLLPDLSANDADDPGPDADYALERTRQRLRNLIIYAEKYPGAQSRLLQAKRQLAFGAPPPAPTRMGNVAKSVQSYAVERYKLNFELFWSRLQFLAQKDKDFGPLLLATKTQLDFLVSCSALTFLWVLLWTIGLYVSGGPAWLFATIAVVGPTLGYALYGAAVAQYSTLTELLRSSIDLFRLDLLAALHYQPPTFVAHERNMWDAIDKLHALYEVRDLSYTQQQNAHGAPSSNA